MNVIHSELSDKAFSRHADSHFRRLRLENYHHATVYFHFPRRRAWYLKAPNARVVIEAMLPDRVYSFAIDHNLDREEFWNMWVDWRDCSSQDILKKIESEILMQKL